MGNHYDPNDEEPISKPVLKNLNSAIDHPSYYGGKDNPYEAIKVIENWNLGFNLGNCLKYLARAGKKDAIIQDLKKARWYLDREISNIENSKPELVEGVDYKFVEAK